MPSPSKPRVWRLRPSDPDLARDLARGQDLHPAVATLLAARGISEEGAVRRHLEPRLADLTAPDQMADLDRLVVRLGHGVLNREPLGIFGDYDVDGVSSTALLGDYLERCGAQVTLRVARRDEGYGFGLAQARELADAGVKLLVLLDCGTSDHEAVAAATEAGVDVVALDHHKLTRDGWPGLALVNPQRPDCKFPFKGLCTAGLVFYLVARLRRHLEARGERAPDPRECLDLVALGTIADVAPLQQDNRILVSRGLEQLSSTTRPGLQELLRLCKLAGKLPTSGDVGWQISPRLNAPGRLGDASVALECLWQRDPERAVRGARECDRINEQRKELQTDIMDQALALGAEQDQQDRAFILVASQDWHPGVIGIVASRLVDRFGRPGGVICIKPGEECRGSARSIPGVDLVGLLQGCEDLLVRYGGHKYAAGFSVLAHQIEPLQQRLHQLARPAVDRSGGRPVDLDSLLTLDQVDLDLCRNLQRLEPFGQGNPQPLFGAREVQVTAAREVGEGHLKLEVQGSGKVREAIGFGMLALMPEVGQQVDLAFVPEINNYMGQRVQLRLVDLRPSDGSPIEVAPRSEQ